MDRTLRRGLRGGPGALRRLADRRRHDRALPAGRRSRSPPSDRCPEGTMVHRSGARPGDLVFVSGTIGDGALGLRLRLGKLDPATGGRGRSPPARPLPSSRSRASRSRQSSGGSRPAPWTSPTAWSATSPISARVGGRRRDRAAAVPLSGAARRRSRRSGAPRRGADRWRRLRNPRDGPRERRRCLRRRGCGRWRSRHPYRPDHPRRGAAKGDRCTRRGDASREALLRSLQQPGLTGAPGKSAPLLSPAGRRLIGVTRRRAN